MADERQFIEAPISRRIDCFQSFFPRVKKFSLSTFQGFDVFAKLAHLKLLDGSYILIPLAYAYTTVLKDDIGYTNLVLYNSRNIIRENYTTMLKQEFSKLLRYSGYMRRSLSGFLSCSRMNYTTYGYYYYHGFPFMMYLCGVLCILECGNNGSIEDDKTKSVSKDQKKDIIGLDDKHLEGDDGKMITQKYNHDFFNQLLEECAFQHNSARFCLPSLFTIMAKLTPLMIKHIASFKKLIQGNRRRPYRMCCTSRNIVAPSHSTNIKIERNLNLLTSTPMMKQFVLYLMNGQVKLSSLLWR